MLHNYYAYHYRVFRLLLANGDITNIPLSGKIYSKENIITH